MKDFLIKVLDFCNILDDNRCLSLTNLAVIAMVVKMVCTKSPDMATLGATVVSLMNYMHKRSTNNSANQDDKIGPKS